MGLSSLFTVLGVAVAIYAVLPRWRRLSLRFRIGPFVGISLAVITVLLVHYYQLRHPLGELGFSLSPLLVPSPFTAQELTYITIVAVFVVALIKVSLPVYLPHRIHSLQNLVDELRGADVYSGLLAVLERNGNFLLRVLTRNYPHWTLRSYLTFPPVFASGPMYAKHWTEYSWIPEWSHPYIFNFAKRLPTGNRHVSTALAIVRQTLLSRSVVKELAEKRPYVALNVLGWRFTQQAEFLDLYFRALLQNRDSILYHEVLASLTMESGYHRFSVPQSNRLLYYLFSDVKRAVELSVWKPVGDNVNRRLDQLYRSNRDPYNLAYDPEFDDERVRSDLYVGMLFFGIMVPEALYQGEEYHMWLMYFKPFTEKILRNYNPSDPAVDLDAEWPIRYSFLLYTMIDSLRNWILTPLRDEKLDPTSEHLQVNPDDLPGGRNVPSASIVTIAKCIYFIAEAESLTDQFKGYLIRIVYSLYFNVLEEEEGTSYAAGIRVALAGAGRRFFEPSARYRQTMLSELDTVRYEKPQWRREDIEALREAIMG